MTERMNALFKRMRIRHLDAVILDDEANIRALTGITCDNARLVLENGEVTFYTDFRYIPMVHRVAPKMRVRELKKFEKGKWRKVGYEGTLPTEEYLALRKMMPRTGFTDIQDDVLLLRAVKTPEEIAGIRAAQALNAKLMKAFAIKFKPGMPENLMRDVIRDTMYHVADGEAFETIVCAGANAAECHHVPDESVWQKDQPLLIDMGVKCGDALSDMTRTFAPRVKNPEFDEIYKIVLEAQEAALAAAKPGMTGKQLDAVARRIIRKAGYGKYFGHSLGHGVGAEIHEWPVASPKSDTVLKPGMVVTIEPGIYLEGKFGVRIEDLILITEHGCENLTNCAK